jgi:hypothetical protein
MRLKKTDAECVIFFWRFMVCTPTTFSRMSCDGLSTTVSSCEIFFGAVVVVEGRTTLVDFFGLSSSLEENHLS